MAEVSISRPMTLRIACVSESRSKISGSCTTGAPEAIGPTTILKGSGSDSPSGSRVIRRDRGPAAATPQGAVGARSQDAAAADRHGHREGLLEGRLTATRASLRRVLARRQLTPSKDDDARI